MLQNEGLDGKKKQYTTCALDSKSPKKGEGAGGGGGDSQVGYVFEQCEPICHFFKTIFWANQFLLLFLISGNPCWCCCVNLSVLQFVGSLSCVRQ